MPKKKKQVKIKKSSKNYSWILYTACALIILAALFFLFKGFTGNAIGYGFSSPFSGSYYGGFNSFMENIKIAGIPILEIFIGPYNSADFFFVKILLFLMVFAIVFVSLTKSNVFGENNRKISIIITFCVTILAVRFLPDSDIINMILLPYNALGVAITTLLPMIIFFFFVHNINSNGLGRRLLWIFYGIIFGVLWFNRRTEMSPLGNQIYGFALLALILVFLFDSKINQYFRVKGITTFVRNINTGHIAALKVEYRNLLPGQADPDVKKRLRDIEKELRDFNTNPYVP